VEFQRFNNTNTEWGYGPSDVGTPDSDYPFTMQQYPPATHNYSIGGQDEPMTNSWTADELERSTSPPSHASHKHPRQQQHQQPVVPDAVINMAAKVGSDKKPFAYVADMNDIRQQRDRVRRKLAPPNSSPTHTLFSGGEVGTLTSDGRVLHLVHPGASWCEFCTH